MFELIFVLVFIATLLVTGLTMVTVFAAAGFALLVMVLLGMLGAVFKILPWLIVIALGFWFFKHYVCCSR
ncbi:envelope stress response protein PspG [Vibrio renipiscarius]|uniref:Phage-shock protein n=1 Tax=Vibrio renipiscarius TaxID=1461322 RepID=A0A0C2KBB3_9VIBR|nr:envelope stress response protein PspG [Vibrio renipiscarius]KII79253.1 phage-shock protein [Vibrio renipiscarius]KII81463.1 phage-shock protein [Vibrio renipiscarius]